MEKVRTITACGESFQLTGLYKAKDRRTGIEVNGELVATAYPILNNKWAMSVKKEFSDWRHRTNEFENMVELKMEAVKCYRYAQENAHDDFKEEPENKSGSVPAKALPISTDAEFYPTPTNLAGKMIGFVNWKEVNTILEPSAGKGDLIEAINSYAHRIVKSWGSGNYFSMDQKFDIDCIEKDENLRYILEGKEMRVVADDFLLYTSRKHYDLIIMNPPFSNGDEHLLRAIEMQEQAGGQVVCLLNAETLLNPYTNRRKVLKEKLKKYGARIEYVKNGFLHAERPTDVTVAIVKIDIPKEQRADDIYTRMKRAYDKVMDENGNCTDLAPNSKFEALVRLYEIETAATLEFMEEYNSLCSHIMSSDGSSKGEISLRIGGHDCNDFINSEDVNRYMRSVRAKYWHKLFQLPEITNRLTSHALHNWDSRINELKDYEFSEYNVKRVMVELRGQLVQDIESEIMKLFEKLSCEHAYGSDFGSNIHYYNGWKTNKAHKVNNKVIIPAYGCFSSYGNGFDSWTSWNLLSDIEKSLDYLDGRKESDLSHTAYELEKYNRGERASNIHCKYFTVTFYKKGTCHIKFHPEAQHIVDALNIFAARNRGWLPPSYGKVRYNKMDQEEQKVVDEFQGKAAYDQVMDNPDVYLIEANTPLLLA